MTRVRVRVQGQAVQDVEKAVSLFESTGRISATVMEARYSQHSRAPRGHQRALVDSSPSLSQYIPAAVLPDALPSRSAEAEDGERPPSRRPAHACAFLS